MSGMGALGEFRRDFEVARVVGQVAGLSRAAVSPGGRACGRRLQRRTRR